MDNDQHPTGRWPNLPLRGARSRSRGLEAARWDPGKSWDPGKVQADFDRLAGLSDDGWDHNAHYHQFLLRRLPPRCRQTLDVGCGTGAPAPGGTLLLLDIHRPRSLADLVVSLAAVPASRLLGLRHTGRLSEPPEVRQAWEEHGRTDRYLTLAEVRSDCAAALPGAAVRRHLLWRYSIVWRRPPG